TLPPLTEAIRDEQWQVRGIAVLAVGQFGELADPLALAAVHAALQDDHEAVREAAAVAIANVSGDL
ncbi:MAG: HEAT repeat domain-containing protein, partial [Gammaproteobacteria bacterium]|nr:HEAT repeat domain-containing protein [Gammaproteobacteria bacterium]